MQSDATRDTFVPAKHLSRVIMQQGRVALDADHNEQVAIFWHYLRALAQDVIGAPGAPATGGGFALTLEGKELRISNGRYYVDGILVENEVPCLYTDQPSYRLPADDPLANLDKAGEGDMFFVYLDVWEHHVTWIEDGSLREVALGGPDTCTRAKVVWQVRVAPYESGEGNNGKPDCAQELGHLVGIGNARLAAQVDPGAVTDAPCVMPPESKYRGPENQLYRVEIHRPGDVKTPATFKWSRDNGSILTALNGISGNDLVVASTRGFEAGDWVELTNDDSDLRRETGSLARVANVQDGALSLDPDEVPLFDVDTATNLHPKVRRWNQTSSEDIVLVNGAVPVTESPTDGKRVWIDLEDGVQVLFAEGGQYRSGDYWLIPARVATGKIEWPSEPGTGVKGPVADLLPPRGIRHHYAPLGFVTWDGTAFQLTKTCRRTFAPVPSLTGQ